MPPKRKAAKKSTSSTTKDSGASTGAAGVTAGAAGDRTGAAGAQTSDGSHGACERSSASRAAVDESSRRSNRIRERLQRQRTCSETANTTTVVEVGPVSNSGELANPWDWEARPGADPRIAVSQGVLGSGSDYSSFQAPCYGSAQSLGYGFGVSTALPIRPGAVRQCDAASSRTDHPAFVVNTTSAVHLATADIPAIAVHPATSDIPASAEFPVTSRTPMPHIPVFAVQHSNQLPTQGYSLSARSSEMTQPV